MRSKRIAGVLIGLGLAIGSSAAGPETPADRYRIATGDTFRVTTAVVTGMTCARW